MLRLVAIAAMLPGCGYACEDTSHFFSYNIVEPTAEQAEQIKQCTDDRDCELCESVLKLIPDYDPTYYIFECTVSSFRSSGVRVHLHYDNNYDSCE